MKNLLKRDLKMKSDLKDLAETIHELRIKKFGDLPEDLINKILEIETEICDDRSEASKRISKVIEDYLSSKKVK